jgi:hypothetical protein
MKPALAPIDEASGEPWYASAAFWTGRLTFGLGLLVAVGIGIAWYLLGGFPRDHDTFGSVSVPGQQVLELPAGDVRVNFENDTTGSGDTRSIEDRPEGLAVRILPANGGEEIAVRDVPNWLFSSISGDRGARALRQGRDPQRRQLPDSGHRRRLPRVRLRGGEPLGTGERLGARDHARPAALVATRLGPPARDTRRTRGLSRRRPAGPTALLSGDSRLRALDDRGDARDAA